ncbi:hypothetical protein [Streptomyces sp. NPDC048266]
MSGPVRRGSSAPGASGALGGEVRAPLPVPEVLVESIRTPLS